MPDLIRHPVFPDFQVASSGGNYPNRLDLICIAQEWNRFLDKSDITFYTLI